MENNFLARLTERPLLCDGAMGTVLYSKGVAFEKSFEDLNLTHPALVAEVHRDYIEAGADLILTNSLWGQSCKAECASP